MLERASEPCGLLRRPLPRALSGGLCCIRLATSEHAGTGGVESSDTVIGIRGGSEQLESRARTARNGKAAGAMSLKFDVGFSEDENLKWRKSMEVRTRSSVCSWPLRASRFRLQRPRLRLIRGHVASCDVLYVEFCSRLFVGVLHANGSFAQPPTACGCFGFCWAVRMVHSGQGPMRLCDRIRKSLSAGALLPLLNMVHRLVFTSSQ